MAGDIFNESESHFGSLTPEKCLATGKTKMKGKKIIVSNTRMMDG
jgi:hypothetical protein